MKMSTLAIASSLMLGIAGGASALDATLGPGKYVVTVSPAISEQAADRIEKQLDRMAGIGSNDAKPNDSTVHFTVKDNSRVDVSRVKNAISAVIADATISDPMVAAEDTPQGKNY